MMCNTLYYTYNRILLISEKERNTIMFDSMDKPGEHYVKWNGIQKHYIIALLKSKNSQK